MRQFGLIGYPLSHSFSKKYFEKKFLQEGITNATFENFAIDDINKLPQILETHPELKGLAVTIPYKRAVIKFLSDYDEIAKQTGACNCIKISEEKLIGFNTDVAGFEKSFVKHLQPEHTKALILGRGGAAAAVQFVLKKLNIEELIVSRTASQKNNFICYDDVDENILKNYFVIINCTPLGTEPNIDEAPKIPYHLLTPKHYLFDLVYNPAETKFLLLAEQQGATIQNGYEMLVIQAEENWRIWNEER